MGGGTSKSRTTGVGQSPSGTTAQAQATSVGSNGLEAENAKLKQEIQDLKSQARQSHSTGSQEESEKLKKEIQDLKSQARQSHSTGSQEENEKLKKEIQELKAQLAEPKIAGGSFDKPTSGSSAFSSGTAGSASKPARIDRSDSLVQLRKKLVGENGSMFDRILADGTEELTFDALKTFVAANDQAVDEDELQQLFSELDADKSGKVTKQEFLDGLKATQSLKGSGATTSLLRAIGMVDIVSKHLTTVLQRRFYLGSDAEIDVRMILEKADSNIIAEAWDAAKDEVVHKGEEQIKSMVHDRHSALSEQQFNNKFASNVETMEFTYKGLPEFLEGVAGALGLAANNIHEGMKIEFCHSEDSAALFTTSNYGGIRTTPQQEYEFVLAPDMGREYPGGRRGTPLRIFLLAACAREPNSEATLDTPLAELDSTTRDAVKAVLLRRAKEAGLARDGLTAVAADDRRLQRLAGFPRTQLKALAEEIGEGFKAVEASKETGVPPFGELVRWLVARERVSEEELEALVEHSRNALRQARLTAEELIALRLYTGPPFVKLNGTLRGVEAGRKGNTYVNTIHAAISGMVKVAGVSPIPEGRVVYRGQSGMRLPRCFWQGDAQGMKGGVELAFLSTTQDIEVATQYVGTKAMPMVFVGAIKLAMLPEI